ncbi:DUF4236 domain-containing protein [Mycobacteroides abscessus]|uniref:DUF4236 domain-containing protein n=1 Tax=Mycobacteroides abscessus TaxID=36809 RepID=UPI000929EAD2|nr:Uncharacterised protein [Mycobacteroides abscessus subsp. bolletii]SHS27627.1 Uncharacterised protein [Mycobacteroides abscessus subsp. bolletii]SHS78312.1 Uncharacterised protein [Mycobacteroides abscessus subsp. bolletii]SKF64910.1 Uncharacterised protein [Mycobacteroides abscessus subsp. bolletii]SKG37575.1 Uncharacterised protein [Mycobacteroides abscessus subsp. bolletii]
MVQFRRSKKFGPFRLTLSKSGLGISAGAGPLRISRGADGKVRRTIRVPGTGISDTKVIGGRKPAQRTNFRGTSPAQVPIKATTFRYGPITVAQPLVARGHNGTVVFDGRIIRIDRAAVAAGFTDLTAPITAVHAVEWVPPSILTNGHIRLVIPTATGLLSHPLPLPQEPSAVIVTYQQQHRFSHLLSALEFSRQHPSSR